MPRIQSRVWGLYLSMGWWRSLLCRRCWFGPGAEDPNLVPGLDQLRQMAYLFASLLDADFAGRWPTSELGVDQ
jgi:hypothetical protein